MILFFELGIGSKNGENSLVHRATSAVAPGPTKTSKQLNGLGQYLKYPEPSHGNLNRLLIPDCQKLPYIYCASSSRNAGA